MILEPVPGIGGRRRAHRLSLASLRLTSVRLNGSGSCGFSSDGYSTGESPWYATQAGCEWSGSSMKAFCAVISCCQLAPKSYSYPTLAPGRQASRTRMPSSSAASSRVKDGRSEEHTSELQSRGHLVCRLLLEKKNTLLQYPSHVKKKNIQKHN